MCRLKYVLTKVEPNSKNRIMIFCMTKKGCDSLTRGLRQNGWQALGIHGDKSQQERDSVLNEFRSGRSPILVATDVAARGLDVKDVKIVINYDFPSCCEDYVHRIGRTGRAGDKGTAYSFFTQENARLGKELIKILEQSEQAVPDALRQLAHTVRGGITPFFSVFIPF